MAPINSQLHNLAKAKIALLKKAAWDDFYVFAKYVCGRDQMQEQPHRELCEFITSGLEASETLNLKIKPVITVKYVIEKCKKGLIKLILLPRGTFKSTVATNALPVWLLWHNQDLRLMIDSETLSSAKMYLSGIRDMLDNNEMLKMICTDDEGNYLLEPNKGIAGGFTEEQVILKHRKKLGLKEPSIFCSGVDNARTGMHPDVIIMDDLVSERNVGTDTQLAKTKDHYRYSLSLLEPGGLHLIIGTRYHMADLYGDLITEESFDVLLRPAIDTEGKLYFPTRLTNEFLTTQRKAQGSYIFSCNPKGAPVLMSDFTFKDVSEIKIGDEVIGFTRGTKTEGTRSKLVRTKVTAVGSKIAPVVRVVMEDGSEIRCTPDHKWFTGRKDYQDGWYRKEYMPARKGGQLFSVTKAWREQPTTKDLMNYQYLSAMIDGEGAVKYGSIQISQDFNFHQGVCDRIDTVLTELKIPYNRCNYKGNQYSYVLNGGREEKIKLLNFGSMGKANDVVNNIYQHAGQPMNTKDKMVDIIPDGEEEVYSFQTETGNYVIWGYMSKNCQYQLQPVDDANAVFKKANIHYYEETPPLVAKYILVDLAISQKDTADFFVCMCVGMDREKKLYVLDYDRAHYLPKQQIEAIFTMFKRHDGDVRVKAVGIETVAYQKALLYLIKDEMRRRGIYMPLKELRADRDKVRRIQALQPLFENEDIFIRYSQVELEQELLEFPVSRHDDVIDALAYILQLLRAGAMSMEAHVYEYKTNNQYVNY